MMSFYSFSLSVIINNTVIIAYKKSLLAGLRRQLSQFADEIVNTILDMIKDSYSSVLRSIADDKIDNIRIRLTEYSEVPVLFYVC